MVNPPLLAPCHCFWPLVGVVQRPNQFVPQPISRLVGFESLVKSRHPEIRNALSAADEPCQQQAAGCDCRAYQCCPNCCYGCCHRFQLRQDYLSLSPSVNLRNTSRASLSRSWCFISFMRSRSCFLALARFLFIHFSLVPRRMFPQSSPALTRSPASHSNSNAVSASKAAHSLSLN